MINYTISDILMKKKQGNFQEWFRVPLFVVDEQYIMYEFAIKMNAYNWLFLVGTIDKYFLQYI